MKERLRDNTLNKIQRKVRSFVKREGRLTKGQALALETLWPTYGLSESENIFDFNAIFGNENPVVLEIGFGNGESLVTMCKNAPELNFIGIEVHRPGVGHLLKKAEKSDVRNLRVMCEDATEILKKQFPNNSLFRVQLYFADPWPKKKHHKRRIIQEDFVHIINQKLQPGGTLHLATDWENYAIHMLDVLDNSTLKNIAGSGNFSPKPDYRPTTKFETRGIKLGHSVRDLVYQKR